MADIYTSKAARSGEGGFSPTRRFVAEPIIYTDTLTFANIDTEKITFIPFPHGLGHIVVQIVQTGTGVGVANADDVNIFAYPCYEDPTGYINKITSGGAAVSSALVDAQDFTTDAMFRQDVSDAFDREDDANFVIGPPGILVGIISGAGAMTATFAVKAWVS